MTYPYSDCCPNLPGAGDNYGPCDDGWCCTHETYHEEPAVTLEQVLEVLTGRKGDDD